MPGPVVPLTMFFTNFSHVFDNFHGVLSPSTFNGNHVSIAWILQSCRLSEGKRASLVRQAKSGRLFHFFSSYIHRDNTPYFAVRLQENMVKTRLTKRKEVYGPFWDSLSGHNIPPNGFS